MNKYWREKVATTSDYEIKSSFNQQQIYISNANKKLLKT